GAPVRQAPSPESHLAAPSQPDCPFALPALVSSRVPFLFVGLHARSESFIVKARVAYSLDCFVTEQLNFGREVVHVLQLFEASWHFADRCCCSRQGIDLCD